MQSVGCGVDNLRCRGAEDRLEAGEGVPPLAPSRARPQEVVRPLWSQKPDRVLERVWGVGGRVNQRMCLIRGMNARRWCAIGGGTTFFISEEEVLTCGPTNLRKRGLNQKTWQSTV